MALPERLEHPDPLALLGGTAEPLGMPEGILSAQKQVPSGDGAGEGMTMVRVLKTEMGEEMLASGRAGVGKRGDAQLKCQKIIGTVKLDFEFY